MIRTMSEKDDVVARKDHHCQLCGLSIPAGSTHFTQRNADESTAWTWRAHTRCNRLLTEYWEWSGINLRDVDEDDVIPDDEFREFLASRVTTGEDR